MWNFHNANTGFKRLLNSRGEKCSRYFSKKISRNSIFKKVWHATSHRWKGLAVQNFWLKSSIDHEMENYAQIFLPHYGEITWKIELVKLFYSLKKKLLSFSISRKGWGKNLNMQFLKGQKRLKHHLGFRQ